MESRCTHVVNKYFWLLAVNQNKANLGESCAIDWTKNEWKKQWMSVGNSESWGEWRERSGLWRRHLCLCTPQYWPHYPVSDTLHVLRHTSEPRRCDYAQLKPRWRNVRKRSACQDWCRSVNESEEKLWEGLQLSFLLSLAHWTDVVDFPDFRS